jgi:hypothetical protein
MESFASILKNKGDMWIKASARNLMNYRAKIQRPEVLLDLLIGNDEANNNWREIV